jgi:hypothetical protein
MFATKLQGASLFFLFAATYRLCVNRKRGPERAARSSRRTRVYRIAVVRRLPRYMQAGDERSGTAA